MVLVEGLRLAAIGVGIRLAVALVATRLMARFFFGVGTVDPLTYTVVSMGMVLVALLAAYVPSRRAASVDPVVALRAD